MIFDGKDSENVTSEVNAVLDRMPGTEIFLDNRKPLIFTDNQPHYTKSDLVHTVLRVGSNTAIMEAANANDWGATIKSNHGSRKPGDFILFADDDNWYQPDALETVRTVVQHDFDALYIFLMAVHMQPDKFIPALDNGEVEVGNVDTGELDIRGPAYNNVVPAINSIPE